MGSELARNSVEAGPGTALEGAQLLDLWIVCTETLLCPLAESSWVGRQEACEGLHSSFSSLTQHPAKASDRVAGLAAS